MELNKKGRIEHHTGRWTASRAILLFLVLAMCATFFIQKFSITGYAITSDVEPIITTQLEEVSASSESSISETTYLEDSSLSVTTEIVRYGAVLGRPVKWEKRITLSEAATLTIQLPKDVLNYTILEVVTTLQEVNETNRTSPVNETNRTSPVNETNRTSPVNETNRTSPVNETNRTSPVNETNRTSPVNETNRTSPVNETNRTSPVNETVPSNESTISIDPLLGEILPENQETPSETKGETFLEEDMTLEVTVPLTGKAIISPKVPSEGFFAWISSLFKKDSLFVGNVISEEEVLQSDEIFFEEPIQQVAIEYYTEAPYAVESDTASGKEIQIVGPDSAHYENVLAFSELQESLNIREVSNVRLYWLNNATYLAFDLYDRDGNGLYDYIEWIVPHLSNQTFEIIVITDALHLDQNRSFISNIYNETRERDNIWSEPISDGHYVRITFERNLTSDRDITVYPRTISGTPQIEIYESDGVEILARFEALNDNEYNTVFLTGLKGEQDTFDLRVVGGEVEFDHIIDPTDGAPRISFFGQTPSNNSIVTNSTFLVNVSSNDTSRHYVFLDLNRDLLLWMPMDVINGSNSPVDLSTYSFNGSVRGNSFLNSTGVFNSSFSFDGTVDSIEFANSNSFLFNSTSNFTISLWAYPLESETQIMISKQRATAPNNGWAFRIDSSADDFIFRWNNGSTNFDVSSADLGATGSILNKWHHVVYRKEGANHSIYLNGTYSSSSIMDLSNGSYNNTASLMIGSRSLAEEWNGSLDEVIVFNRALSPSEIASLYNATQSPYFLNVSYSSNRQYNLTAYAFDSAALRNQTDMLTFTVNDSSPPKVTIVSPLNTSYAQSSITFNVSLDEGGYVNYTLNNGVTNISMTSYSENRFGATNSSIGTGSYTFKVFAFDLAGNLNSTVNVTFSIIADTESPGVTIISPGNYTYATSSIVFNVTLSEQGSVNFTLNGGSINYSMSSSDGLTFNYTNTSIVNGTYIFRAYARDSAGNTNLTSLVYFSIIGFETFCGDGIDNDGDYAIDSQDNDCYTNGTTYYVSSSFGNDSWIGNYPIPINGTHGPKRTITNISATYLYRNLISGDQVLFKRNDSWYENLSGDIISLSNLSGAPNRTTTIGSYGVGQLPSLVLNMTQNETSNVIYIFSVNNESQRTQYVTIRDINFTNGGGYGARFAFSNVYESTDDQAVQNVSFINLAVHGFSNGFVFDPCLSCTVRDSYISENGAANASLGPNEGGHSQGIYSSHSILYIVNNTFIRNGDQASTYDHNSYLSNCTLCVVENNSYLHSLSGLKLRWGSAAFVRGNLFYNSTSGIIAGADSNVSIRNILIERNNFTSLGTAIAWVYQSTGIGDTENATVRNNIFLDSAVNPDSYKGYVHLGNSIYNLSFYNNLFYNISLRNSSGSLTRSLVYVTSDPGNVSNISFKNNIFYDIFSSNYSLIIIDNGSILTSGEVLFDYNLYYRNNSAASLLIDVDSSSYSSLSTFRSNYPLQEGNGVYANPYLLNVSARQFWLTQQSSYVIDRGANATGIVPNDYNLTARPLESDGDSVPEWDIGPYEYLGTIGDTSPPGVTLTSPSDFTYTNSANVIFLSTATDSVYVSNVTFYLWNTTSLIITNLSLVEGSVVTSTFSQLLPREGTYYWNLLAFDNSSNSAFANDNYTLFYDTTAPNVTINSPINAVYTESSFVINVTLNENGGQVLYSLDAGVSNKSMSTLDSISYNASNTSIAGGTYVLSVYVNDSAGNRNDTTNVTFQIDLSGGESVSGSAGSGGGGSGGGSFIPRGNQSEENAILEENKSDSYPKVWEHTYEGSFEEDTQTIQRTLKMKTRVNFSFMEEDHYVGILEIEPTRVLVEIASTPFQTWIFLGQTQNFDITGDELNDIGVTFYSLSKEGLPIIRIEMLRERVTLKRVFFNGTSVAWAFFAFVVVAFIILIVAAFLKSWKNVKRNHSKN